MNEELEKKWREEIEEEEFIPDMEMHAYIYHLLMTEAEV